MVKVEIDFFSKKCVTMMRYNGLCFAEKEKSATFALEN